MLKEIFRHRDVIRESVNPSEELRFINWYIQHGCDLNCYYCKVPKQKVRIMNQEERQEALHRLRRLCAARPVMSIIGGEPTLQPEFLTNTVTDATAAGFLVNVVTNGWGLTPELIEKLGNAGLHHLAISVDCDSGAAKSNLARALQLHNITKAMGILPVINTVITRATDPSAFKEFAATIIDAGFLLSPLVCSPAVHGGVFSSASDTNVPTRLQLREVVPWLAWKKLTTGQVTGTFPFLWTLYSKGAADTGQIDLWHCSPHFRDHRGGQGRGFLTMDSDGFIGPCQEFPRVMNLLALQPDEISLQFLDDLFSKVTIRCSGCLHNCYVIEENLQSVAAFGELPSLMTMARIKAAPPNKLAHPLI